MFNIFKKQVKSGDLVNLRLNNIVIPAEFEACKPRPEKFIDKYTFLRENGYMQSVMIVEYNNGTYTLVDGYTSYLLAKMFGFDEISVKVQW